MTQLKVVHLITNFWVGGAELMLYRLLSRIDRGRFDNQVVSLIGVAPVMRERLQEIGISIRTLGMRQGRPSIRGCLRFWRLLARERPCILQTWMYHADLLGLLSGKLLRVPHVVWNIRHSNLLPEHDSRMTIRIIKLCARLSRWPSAVVVNSYAGRDYFASLGYHPRRWVVIPNGFDLDLFRPDEAAREAIRAELGLDSQVVLIGLISNYRPVKDHATFLRAARMLAESYPNVHFLLAGRDVISANAELTRMIQDHGVQKAVHLLGERSDIPRIMAALDILTSSSTSEGFSNSIGEAMACGVPCVVTDVGDSARIVGDTGLVVPPKNPQAMADGLKQLIDAGAEKRRELGRAARARMEENYSLDRIVQQYEELYLSLKAT